MRTRTLIPDRYLETREVFTYGNLEYTQQSYAVYDDEFCVEATATMVSDKGYRWRMRMIKEEYRESFRRARLDPWRWNLKMMDREGEVDEEA